jgi:hypothetical protein
MAYGNVGAIAPVVSPYVPLPKGNLYPSMLPILGFFVGVSSGHATGLPERLPTDVRATFLSLCNGKGRIIARFGPPVAGLLAGAFGGDFNLACGVMTCFAVLSLLGLLAVHIGGERRDEQLPK